ncbi:bifunctional (p)ppGpp synthetase/guanosine-3',5'-bis(diphosphate) 3'-pyrophosphohydrolase [Candidatus Odyssella thessalonicensis]|uniref:bifunctional (p)ppGpp synthetase/guanosine-3',5'-bis(diphosphate) 3'-pyrophosphohydrolase n=1 Tax=Candidatus Odyssella thessalonicensis TaxID=84647 RepID=UPI000225B74F|nr:bifunctional (p)ppGpp synthetase/guanosine-3',5'-bis(diphosphate) 3'-pyrophosphohydrolase [Candidatus Odyssella thessalonicensis]
MNKYSIKYKLQLLSTAVMLTLSPSAALTVADVYPFQALGCPKEFTQVATHLSPSELEACSVPRLANDGQSSYPAVPLSFSYLIAPDQEAVALNRRTPSLLYLSTHLIHTADSGNISPEFSDRNANIFQLAHPSSQSLWTKLKGQVHRMRTLQCISSLKKRRDIAREAVEAYAPLAACMGMKHVKDELEDRAFKVLDPAAHSFIQSRLKSVVGNAEYMVTATTHMLRQVLKRAQITPLHVNGRRKTPYSIWRKMLHKHVTFDQLSDIMGFRIIVQNLSEAYQVLNVLHDTFRAIPGRVKDYISQPKANGYQSLHTCLIGPFNKVIEVQIRTPEMDEAAEYGAASHWRYKQQAALNSLSHPWL